MKHYASPRFWALYQAFSSDIRELADKNYQLLKSDPRHPSLHFKRIGDPASACITARSAYPSSVHWFWIGTHADYDKIVG